MILASFALPAFAWDYTELTVIDAVIVEDNPAVTLGQGFWHGGAAAGGGYEIYLPLILRDG